MAGLENEVFKVLGSEEDYKAYREYVPEEILSPVGRRLLEYVDKWYSTFEAPVDWFSFGSWLRLSAASKDTHLEAMCQLCEITGDVETDGPARDILNRAVERDISEQIEGHLEREEEFDTTLVRGLVDKLEGFRSANLEAERFEVASDIEDVLRDSHVGDDGFPFSLDILRRSVGPIRQGDTIYIAARPEVGKTTFLTHQAGYMMYHTSDTSAVLFANEEDGNRVMLRLYQSVLNWTTKEILDDPATARREYESKMGTLDRVRVIHSSDLHRRDCERIVEKYDPDLVLFNSLYKIKGFDGRRTSDVEKHEYQARWMREVANRYGCATMTAWWAGGEAHGKAWIEQNDIYMSKTGVVGEADVILGIGKVFDTSVIDTHRFFHPSKNKLPGDSKTEEHLRHGYFDGIYLDAARGRFYE